MRSRLSRSSNLSA
ncbi:4Fe-4S binding domain protein, partial [Vibrio parahaemolyticus V-223/04]